MLKFRLSLSLVLLSRILFASESGLMLNEQEYFERPGLNVMVFHDFYPEGHQGGVSIIQHGERVASNGDLRLDPAPGQWQPIPKMGERTVLRDNNEISVSLSFPDSSRDKKGFNPIDYPDLNFSYKVRVTGEGTSFRIIIDLDEPLPDEWIGRAGFNLELFPGLLFGKSYYIDSAFGYFPPQPNGPMAADGQNEIQIVPMGEGRSLTIAPECDALRMVITSLHNPVQLIDGRGKHNNGWFIARTLIAQGAAQNAVEWIVTPSVIPGWMQAPVIHVSQVGYYPEQHKTAFIELDKNDSREFQARLIRIENDGTKTGMKEALPVHWGIFLRSHYRIFDFSSVKAPGIYQIEYGPVKTEIFQISPQLYSRHIWQPTLEFFLPVQMCHMKIMENYRVWHGLCHMDDALMAPVNYNHFDGYKQGPSTLTDYNPGDPVPGLNKGGWHDAGDYDLRVESQAGTVYILSLAREAFGVDYDATTIDQEKHLVEIHIPDGKPDILQQIEHGVLTILGGYKNMGRLYRGIICPTIRQYVLLGDGSTMTDNRVYDPALDEEARAGEKSGRPDDRWVFTEENHWRDLQTAASLAAASRVLRAYNPDLSKDCLDAAAGIWNTCCEAENRFKIDAAAELLITTGDAAYQKFLLSELPLQKENIRRHAMVIGRVLPLLKNKNLTKDIRKNLTEYKRRQDDAQKENPFGVPYRPHIWGAGWNIQSWGVSQYFLHTGFPDIFPRENMLNALQFVLGCHPGSNTASFASGVGSKSVTVAYGVNRADWSYIPGGVVSGTALIRPDFPELKEWPFFWQQTEYVIGGGASNFMFMVLAANQWFTQE